MGRPLIPLNIYTASILALLLGLFALFAWRFMGNLAVNLDTLTTFSGMLGLFGTLAWLFGRPFTAGILYTILGAAGTGAAWDRWSYRVGHWNRIETLFSGVAPTRDEAEMFFLHFPFLVIGLILLYRARRASQTGPANQQLPGRGAQTRGSGSTESTS